MAFNITNYLDDTALYLGLYRLSGETDESFVSRIKRFSKVKYNTDYSTQIRSIGEQVGAKIYPVAEIYCETPYAITLDFEHLTIKTYPTNGSDPLYIRAYINPKENILSKLQTLLTGEDRITLSILDDTYLELDNKFIFRETNIHLHKELIKDKYTRLLFGDIIEPLTQLEPSIYLQNKVTYFSDIKKVGDYFFDPVLGFIATYNLNGNSNFGIGYYYYEKRFLIYASTVTLTPMINLIKQGLSDEFISHIPQLLNNKTSGD